MRLFRWFCAGAAGFVLAGTTPALAQNMPDEATRARVADWIERCPAPSDACRPVMRRIEDTALLGSWCLAIDVQWDTARLVRDPAAILLFISECVPIIAAALDEAGEGDEGAGEAGYLGPVEPVDRVMQAVKRSNLRSGPGTTYGKVGLLDVGDEVRVTGEAGDWLRIEAPGGGEAFVHAPLLEEAGGATIEPEGSNWSVTENQPCHVWNYGYIQNEPFTWSGACLDGKASGQGTLTLRGGDLVYEGGMRGGKFHEYGTLRSAGGNVHEGSFVDGVQHGQWVERDADGTVREGSYVDGKRHGQWVERYADGAVHEGPYVDGERQGQWVLRFAAGNVAEGPFVDGERHGQWVLRFADGDVYEGPYVDGERRGQWVERHADGDVYEGPYVDGERQGQWVFRYADGDVEEGSYEDGKRHGQWVVRFADGEVGEGPYVDGERHGQWVFRYADGAVTEGFYVDGEWVERDPDGDRLEEVVDAPSEQAPHTQDSAEGQQTETATATSAADSAGSEAHAGVSENGSGATASGTPRLPVDATHCVKLHEVASDEPFWDAWEDYDGTVHTLFRFTIIQRGWENTCAEPIVLRVRHFQKYSSEMDWDHSYVIDSIYPGRYSDDIQSHWNAGVVLEVNNTEFSDDELREYHKPPSEIAYCAEFVDTDTTPEYLSGERYRVSQDGLSLGVLEDGTEFFTYSVLVDHLRLQGRKVGPELKTYYDAYFESLEHSPCYAEVVREPPNGYEHFPPLDRYEVSRMSTFVTFHKLGGGFEALSFDENADFGGASFHDVGGTDTHYISDLPTPRVGWNE